MGTDKIIKTGRKKLIGAAILLILGVAVLFLPGFTGRNGRIKAVPLKNDSEYRVFYEDQIPFGTIGDRDWFVADDRIFVLFEKRSYLSVYDPDGAFLYSIQTYHINNGTERIAYRDGQLIIHTRSGGIYLFDGPEKQEYIPWDRSDTDAMERNRAYYDYIEHEFDAKKLNREAKYYLENNTIYHLKAHEESEPILSFPSIGWGRPVDRSL